MYASISQPKLQSLEDRGSKNIDVHVLGTLSILPSVTSENTSDSDSFASNQSGRSRSQSQSHKSRRNKRNGNAETKNENSKISVPSISQLQSGDLVKLNLVKLQQYIILDVESDIISINFFSNSQSTFNSNGNRNRKASDEIKFCDINHVYNIIQWIKSISKI